MLVIFPVFNRIELLPYFLRYYSSIGATQFVCVLYRGQQNPFYKMIQRFGSRYQLAIRTSTNVPHAKYNAFAEMYGLNLVRKEFAKEFRWYCIADLDEFHFFHGLKMPTVVRLAERHGFQAVGGRFVDRISADGTFPAIRGSLDRRFPLGCEMSLAVGACPTKIALARSNIKIAIGHHYAKAKVAWGPVETHHFKWHNGIYEIIMSRYKYYRKQGIPWCETELAPQLKMIKQGINLNDPKLQLRKAKKLGV